MTFNELMPILHALNRVDKLRAMQFFIRELAQEESALLLLDNDCPVWSPYNSFEAGSKMLNILMSEACVSNE